MIQEASIILETATKPFQRSLGRIAVTVQDQDDQETRVGVPPGPRPAAQQSDL